MVFALPRLLLHNTLTPTTLRLFNHGRFRLGCPPVPPRRPPRHVTQHRFPRCNRPLAGPRGYGAQSLVTPASWQPTQPLNDLPSSPIEQISNSGFPKSPSLPHLTDVLTTDARLTVAVEDRGRSNRFYTQNHLPAQCGKAALGSFDPKTQGIQRFFEIGHEIYRYRGWSPGMGGTKSGLVARHQACWPMKASVMNVSALFTGHCFCFCFLSEPSTSFGGSTSRHRQHNLFLLIEPDG